MTIFRAAKRTGRVLLIDLYTAVVLEATGRDTIPQSGWEGIRLYIPQSQRVHIKKNELFDDLARHKANRIFPEDLPGLRDRAVMLFRPMMMRDRGIGDVLEGARLTYSMWEGYLKEASVQRVVAWLKEHDIPMQVIHTSGHASAIDLQRFAAALAPPHARAHPLLRDGPLRRALRQRRPERGRCVVGRLMLWGRNERERIQKKRCSGNGAIELRLIFLRIGIGWWPDLLAAWSSPSGELRWVELSRDPQEHH